MQTLKLEVWPLEEANRGIPQQVVFVQALDTVRASLCCGVIGGSFSITHQPNPHAAITEKYRCLWGLE